jgi:hypothetical protein
VGLFEKAVGREEEGWVGNGGGVEEAEDGNEDCWVGLFFEELESLPRSWGEEWKTDEIQKRERESYQRFLKALHGSWKRLCWVDGERIIESNKSMESNEWEWIRQAVRVTVLIY